MQTHIFQDEDAWKQARIGKIGGTRAYSILPKKSGYGKSFWEVLAERVCEQADGEDVMARGLRLEEEAISRLEKEISLEFDIRKIIWTSDEVEGLQVSPDGVGITASVACEVKCLNSAHHLEAYFSKDFPKSSSNYNEYHYQKKQYFQVNPDLETLYVVFYDPRCPIDFFYIEFSRESLEEELKEDMVYMKQSIAELERLEKLLTF